MFKHAIVRRPCPNMVRGLTTAGLGKPKYDIAVVQHNAYIDALIECGLDVTVMDADDEYPDSTFIEDTALCTQECAIVLRPGAKSRRGETDGVKEVLLDFYENIERIREPCTVDGGDILMVGSHYFIGKSSRTNDLGANYLIKILEKYEMSGSKVEDMELLHLKSGCAYLEENTMLACWDLVRNSAFNEINKIRVEKEECYAANSLWINGTVLTPLGNPTTKKRIEKAGYKVIELDVLEFQKLDGGLSCLSLRF